MRPARSATRVVRALTVAVACAASSAAQVTLRGQAVPLETPVRAITDQGVEIVGGPEPGDVRVIPLDRVAAVGGPMAGAFAPYAPLAESLWRARTRLARGDTAAAEPVFERAFADYQAGGWGRTGPTSALIAEGLLRCRLARGSLVGGVPPWASLLASGAALPPSGIARDSVDAPIGFLAPPELSMDPQTGLIPTLPPIWLATPATAAFGRSEPIVLPDGATPAQQRAALLSELYRVAAAHENAADTDMPPIPEALRGDRAVRIVNWIVVSRAGDGPQRDASRRELAKLLPEAAPHPWLEGWLRLAIGRSLMREGGRDASLEAVAQLAHLPARLADAAPYLTGLALGEMAVAMNQAGDVPAALSIRDELRSKYPGHPALDAEPLRRWPRSGASAGGAP